MILSSVKKYTGTIIKNNIYTCKTNETISYVEIHEDGTEEMVDCVYAFKDQQEGYFCHEYRNPVIPEKDHKASDILALILNKNPAEAQIYVYDVKRSLKEDEEADNLVTQINSTYKDAKGTVMMALDYPKISVKAGVITTFFDSEKLKEQADYYKKEMEEWDSGQINSLAKKKKRTKDYVYYRNMREMIDRMLEKKIKMGDGSILDFDIRIAEKDGKRWKSTLVIEGC